jgi:putative Mn2+ efflux pump MntP
MTGIEIWLLAVGLSMDCFAVSIASGMLLKRFRWGAMLTIAFAFGLFQALMPLVGWLFAGTFSHLIKDIDHWIAFGILAFLGGRMIRESFKEEDCKQVFDPTNLKVVLALAVATSIDALAVGVSFAFLDVHGLSAILPRILIIGFVSLVASLVGLTFGIRSGCGIARKLRMEMWGGIILILIGVKILIEHLFFHG